MRSAQPRPPKLTRERALAIQAELIAAYSQAEFQAQLLEAWEAADGDELEQGRARQEACLPVQRPVLEKHGFEPSPRGLAQCTAAFQPFSNDAEVAESSDILQWLVNPASRRGDALLEGRDIVRAAKAGRPSQIWRSLGPGLQLVKLSFARGVQKAQDAPHSGALASPSFSSGQHSWHFRLRGPPRCEIGVCPAGASLDAPLRDKTWQVHFTGSSSKPVTSEGGMQYMALSRPTLGVLYVNNQQEPWTGPGGAPRPPPSHAAGDEDGLLIHVHIDVEGRVLRVQFKTNDSRRLEYCIEARKPKIDGLEDSVELFPYVGLGHVGTTVELCGPRG